MFFGFNHLTVLLFKAEFYFCHKSATQILKKWKKCSNLLYCSYSRAHPLLFPYGLIILSFYNIFSLSTPITAESVFDATGILHIK